MSIKTYKSKEYQPDDVIVTNLKKLAAELWEKHKGKSITNEAVMLGLKINSCLFRDAEGNLVNKE